MEIVFATNNTNKLEEIRRMLGSSGITILSLSDIGCHEDIPETADSLEGNAMIKAMHVYDRYGKDCFADDTGLEVDALGGEPGIYSARYAGGEGHDSEANMRKLLANLEGAADRSARFRTVICLATRRGVPPGMPLRGTGDTAPGEPDCCGEPAIRFFEGVAQGSITTEKSGESGFGYDPVFRPEGYDETFAELGAEVKNRISHRAKAVSGLSAYLLTEYIKNQGGGTRD